MDILLPDVRVQSAAPRIIDATGRFSSPLVGTTRTVGRPGDRWAFQLTYNALQNKNTLIDKARMEAFVAAQRGAAGRVLFSPIDYVQRGSFPSGELLTNGTFQNGTTGFSIGSVGATPVATVADRILRVQATSAEGGYFFSQSFTGIQYAPYVCRVLFRPGTVIASVMQAEVVDSTLSLGSSGNSTNSELSTASAVLHGTGGVAVGQLPSFSLTAGDFFESPMITASRCALADNAPNMLLQSDLVGGTSPWQTHESTWATSGVSPDGNSTARTLVESTATDLHYASQDVTVASTALDYAYTVYVKAGNRGFAFLQLTERTGFTSVSAYINLTTGALGTTATGANWSGLRTFINSAGSGWWRLTLVARKTNAATALTAFTMAATANGTNSYAGTGGSTVAISAWRASLAQSSVPVRASGTTAAASTGTAQLGSMLYLKGLPVSTAGLLLPGDWCEINLELKKVTASLNSDAAGLGALQFSPPLRVSPADNDPLIVNRPMGRFIMKGSENGWNSTPGIFSDFSFDLIEAIG